MKPPAPITTRFWAKVDFNGPTPDHMPQLGACWIWTASVTKRGYGKFGMGAGGWEPAHRVAWRLSHGRVFAAHLCVLHHCDNPRCVNPAHLFVGTRLDNALDRDRKGRGRWPGTRGDRNGSRTRPERRPRGDDHWTRARPARLARGERNGFARLTESDVRAILASNDSPAAIAKRFSICRTHVDNIRQRRVWGHVEGS